jgi:hypothetical protein
MIKITSLQAIAGALLGCGLSAAPMFQKQVRTGQGRDQSSACQRCRGVVI